jgi:outer membrane protein OmpA-like peptidoglycan-associated protein
MMFGVLRFFSLLVMLLVMALCSHAQNLVVNGSFEEENVCTEFDKNCSPEGWIISSLQSQFYFDEAKSAWDGKHYVGIVAGMNGRYGSRNFISSQLLCGMRKDAWYSVSFYLLPGSEMTDSLGVLFSSDDVLYRKFGLRGVEPSFFATDVVLTGRDNWRRYTALYKAKGNESFITIGFFKKSTPEHTRTALSRPTFYGFVDSVTVRPVNPMERLCDNAEEERRRLYEWNERHSLLDKAIYPRQRKPPVQVELVKTTLLKVDTLVIPDVLFATNSYMLTPRAVKLLDSFSKAVTQKRIDSMVVEGHTDSRGVKSANQVLSKNRAASVTTQLQKSLAISPPFQQRGWADDKPIADNNTPEGRQRNRRVEIYLYLRE